MGQQIIKQPNGKYCVFSSNIDNLIAYDCDRAEIIGMRVAAYTEEVVKTVTSVCDKLDEGKNAYSQWTMSYEEMLDTVKYVHGQKGVDELLKDMED